MRPRKQTYTMDMYLRKNIKGDIDNKADVQRNFVWNNEQVNELIVTVLTDDYIPPIILGEEGDSKLHIVDGGCRTAALIKFRKGMHKVTSSVENSLIPYKKKITDKSGNIIYEDAVFDIKNKTYDKLPEELKEKFDEYQIETVIHERCNSHGISNYIKRYNNHAAMNTDQKAFTYIDRFAGCIREILNSRFFTECNGYSEGDKNKGVVERIVIESVMCIYHFDKWKKQAKAACKYLNDNATAEEFALFADNLHRLERVITDDVKDIFNKKDSFIFLTLFDRFTKSGLEDKRFVDFLKRFKKEYRAGKRNRNGFLFDEIDIDSSTKDKQVITEKLDMLEELMKEFLDEEPVKTEQADIAGFIAEALNIDISEVEEDIDFYKDTLEVLKRKAIKDGSKLSDPQNELSLLAMVAYSYKEDVDLDDWMAAYARKNHTYLADQKKNYLRMVKDLLRSQRINV